MTCTTTGIRRTAPARWQASDAICAVYWEAEGKARATGYYLSPDPRVMLFFNDVSEHVGVSGQGAVEDRTARPLPPAIYVPAGMPMWTRFRADHRFSHLDLHLRQSWLQARLGAALGEATAAMLMQEPRHLYDATAVAPIGEALKREICAPARHPVIAENLALALVAALLDPPAADPQPEGQSGGLTPVQMKRLTRLLDAEPGRRFRNADLAGAVGLSPSWFAHAFKKTTGRSPLQWQQERRIDRVKQTLLAENVVIADVSSQFGFADQAHFTRVFRQVTGTTPAVWLRESRRR